MAHISEIVKSDKFTSLSDEEQRRVFNGWVEDNVIKNPKFLSLDEERRKQVVEGYANDYLPKTKPWYKEPMALPSWIDKDKWDATINDLETAITQFVDPEKYAKPAPGIISKYSKVATNPLMIAEGLTSFISQIPGFLGGVLASAKILTEKILTQDTESFMKLMTGGIPEFARQIRSGELDYGENYEIAAKTFEEASGAINELIGYTPQHEEANLVGETIMAPASVTMEAFHAVADSDYVSDLPPEYRNQVKGILKFAGDIGGLYLQGKVMGASGVKAPDIKLPTEKQFRTPSKSEILDRIAQERAAIKQRPLETLARKEESLGAEPSQAQIEREYFEKKFKEVPDTETVASTEYVPKDRLPESPVVIDVKPEEPTAPDYDYLQRKATEKLGGKVEVPPVVEEAIVEPQAEYGLKINDRSIPESKKQTAQRLVNEMQKRGYTAKDAAESFDAFLADNQNLKGKIELEKRLTEEQNAETIRGNEKEIREGEGSEDLRGKGQDQEGTVTEGEDAASQVEIPTLIRTNDAVAFGENATPEQVVRLKELREENQKVINDLMEKRDWDALPEIAFKGQLYREAIEASEGRHPLQLKRSLGDIAKDIKTTAEGIIKPEKGSLTRNELDFRQKRAYDRLKSDILRVGENAKRTGKELKQYLTDLGVDPQVVTLIANEYPRLAEKALEASGVQNPNKFKVENPSKDQLESELNIRKQNKGNDTQIRDLAMEYIRDRRNAINLETYETNLFVNTLERNTSKAEREALPFVIEKTDIPKALERPDLEEVYAKSGRKLDPIAISIKQHLEKGWEAVKEHLPEMSADQIEDYITHIWDIPKNRKSEITNWFTTQNRFLKKRYITTLKEGIELYGLKPKILDVGEIIRIHDSVTHKAIENAKFVKKIKAMEKEGVPITMRSDKAPADWVLFDHPALGETVIMHPGKEAMKSGAKISSVRVPIKVHPDLARPLKTIFESRINSEIMNAYEEINGYLKKTNLSLSLFHHLALGETGVGTMGPLKTANIYFNPVKIYKAMVRGEFDVFEKADIARDGVGHGLQLGATHDIPVNKIQSQLNSLANKTRNVPVVGQATKLFSGFNSVWDKALWTYLHDSLKLYAYESLVSKLDPLKNMKKQKQEVAQMVNDTFGGQNWDTLMVSPRMLQVMSWGLLSPDWTISTFRQALAPTGLGKVYKETAGLRKSMGRNFWIRAGLYFGVGINLLNALNRSNDQKENPQYYKGQDLNFWDKTMVGNTTGHKTHLFVGRYADGTERYIRWGKQFRELPELFFDDTGFSPITAAIKKIGGKSAPVIQLVSKVATGLSPSGFRDDDIYGKKGWDKVKGIGISLSKGTLPFSVRNLLKENQEFHWTDVALPSSKGMSRYKSIELFKKAITDQDDRMLSETYQETLRNNLPAYTLFQTALAALKGEGTRAITDGITTIERAEEALKNTTDRKERQKLKRRLFRLKKEHKEWERGMRLLDNAIKEAKRYE